MQQVRDMIQSEIDPSGKFIYVNLEEDESSGFLPKGVLHQHVIEAVKKNRPSKTYVFIDEVSEMEEWEKTVNSLRTKKDVDVYITGANAKLLSGELATYLTGRYVEIKVCPFSFGEFMAARVPEETDAAFDAYLRYGGMPFLAHLGYKDEPCREYLSDLYASILMKDIVRRHKVRDAELLSRIIRYVMSESGHIFSAASILRYLKHERRPVAFDTVMNYLKFGEDFLLDESW